MKKFIYHKVSVLAMSAGLYAATSVGAPQLFFAFDGKLITFDGKQARTLVARKATNESVHVDRVWGVYEGQPVATLRAAAPKDDAIASDNTRGKELVLITPDGVVAEKLATDAVRAFTDPAGMALAYVTSDRRCVVKHGDRLSTLSVEGRVSHVAWSPDATRLAVVLYPEDWSVEKVNNARTTAEFLRLQQSRIVLVDAISMSVLATLVDDGGTNYAPFFSPDSRMLYYIHLDVRDDKGGVRRLDLADSTTTTGIEITHTGEGEGSVPLGRVGTYVWVGDRIVFEAGLADGGGVLWAMNPDGSAPSPLTPGRFPHLYDQDHVAYLDSTGQPQLVTIPQAEEARR